MQKLLKDPNILLALGVLAAVVVLALVWLTFIERNPLQRRLKMLARRRSEIDKELHTKKTSRLQSQQQLDFMRTVVDKLKLNQASHTETARIKLIRAGFRSREAVTIFTFLKVAIGVGIGAAMFFLTFVTGLIKYSTNVQLLYVVGGLYFGWLLPDIFVKNATKKREEAIRRALPDALDLMVICAEAGLSLDATLERVSREIGNTSTEMAEELALAGVEINMMPDRSKALQAMAERVGLPGMLALVNTLIQTERFGTPLAQALRVLSVEMRDERMMRAEEKAAKLPATLTIPMIIFILPTLFIVLVGPAIIKVLATLDARNNGGS